MPESLRLEEFEDFEFLHLIEDVADNEGWASSEDLARTLRLDAPMPERNIGSRCSWLRRYGVLARHEDKAAWKLTDSGRDLIHGKLTEAQKRQLQDASEGRLFAVTRALSGELAGSGQQVTTMMHRQWRYGYAAHRRRNDGG